MRRWPVAILLALGLVAGVATASSTPLSGTYRATITGKPAALNGNWQLKFLPGSGMRVIRNGKPVVVGKAVVTGNRLTVSDRSGPYACSAAEGTGVYTYDVTGTRLTFKALQTSASGAN